MRSWLLIVVMAFPCILFGMDLKPFDNPENARRYESLLAELRCLVCQNQSLAESDADLAKDLRAQVYTLIQSGKKDGEVLAFLVQRYGDFVLYRPPLKTSTYLLWAGPFLLLLLGLFLLWRTTLRHRARAPGALSEEEQNKLRRMLQASGKTGGS